MAQKLTTRNGTTYIPGAYPELEVTPTVTNDAPSGVLTLVGEAEGGPGYLDEVDLKNNYFSPDQFPNILAKYPGGGRLVEAAYAACQPSQDPKLQGAPSRIYIVKTNRSTRASLGLLNLAASAYATVADKSYGELGNLISVAVEQLQAEVQPTTGPFTLIVPNVAINVGFRVNGGALVTASLTATELPPAQVAAIDALTGVVASGGTDRAIITVTGTLALAASGYSVTITRSVPWATNPVVGDSLYIPAGSILQGGGNENRGSYVVTASTSTTVTATKLLDAGGAVGAKTAPINVSATNIAATTDLTDYAPVTIGIDTSDPIDGAGKSLEVVGLATGADTFARLAYQLSATPVTWVSVSGTPKLLTSAAEYEVTVSDSRQLDGVVEEFNAGGDVVLAIGYTGTTATLTITSTTLTTTVTGGSGTSLSLLLSRYVTLADLATYINAQPGYTCTVLLPQFGTRPPTELDRVSAKGICTTFGAKPGRIKRDAQELWAGVQASQLLRMGLTGTNAATAANPRPNGADRGLPAVLTATFLSGGLRAGTTEAEFVAAIDACVPLTMNMGVALISRDASEDIAAGETDSSSTYTLSAVATRIRKQAELQSTQFKRKNRQWAIGVSGSYVDVQRPFAIAQSTQGRLFIAFQDVYAEQALGGVGLFAPWYGAVLAAAMQLAAYNRGIVKREPTESGFYHSYGDWDAGNRGDVEDALRSGLLPASQGIPNPAVPGSSGRWTWVSDQTAFTRDSSFYFNSIQAIYVADQLQLLVAFGVENSVVGESQADLDPNMVKKTVEAYLRIARGLGLIAPSDDAPNGWRSVTVRQVGGTYEVEVNDAKLAGLIYFVPIKFTVSQITRSA